METRRHLVLCADGKHLGFAAPTMCRSSRLEGLTCSWSMRLWRGTIDPGPQQTAIRANGTDLLIDREHQSHAAPGANPAAT